TAEAITSEFDTYEDFLDSQITSLDLYYLEDEQLARTLVELGHRGSGEILKREDFMQIKKANDIKKPPESSLKKTLSAMNRVYSCELLNEISKREEANRNGRLNTIIFIHDKNARYQNISGYIDLADRLKKDDINMYFNGKRKLLPRAGDLSFYNWDTQNVSTQDSSQYQVLADNPNGLRFKNKRDRKMVNVDPKV
ncbi:hypothetical protein A3Q56_07741, partial [Intoshia linei]